MESKVAEKCSWDQANRGEKIGLVWRNRKKISQIINDYLYLPFFLLIILCPNASVTFRGAARESTGNYISLVLLRMGRRGRRNSSGGVR